MQAQEQSGWYFGSKANMVAMLTEQSKRADVGVDPTGSQLGSILIRLIPVLYVFHCFVSWAARARAADVNSHRQQQ
jgi:hypothetical protein